MRYFLILIVLLCSSNLGFSQNANPSNILPTQIIKGLYNGIQPFQTKQYCDSTESQKCIEVEIKDDKLVGGSSVIDSTEVRLTFYTNGRILYITQFINNKVNGPLICFNKKGTIQFILKYEKSKLVGVIYSRNKKLLNKYYKEFGDDSPVSIEKELKIY